LKIYKLASDQGLFKKTHPIPEVITEIQVFEGLHAFDMSDGKRYYYVCGKLPVFESYVFQI